MYRKQVRRRRAILVLLVVACLVLISSHFSESEDGPLHLAQNGVGSVLAPVEEGASRALKPVRDLVNWFDETFDARGENEQLRADVDELRQQLADKDAELQEGLDRGQIAKVTNEDALAGFSRVDARVINRSLSAWNQAIGIDKGTNAGVVVDDAVVAGDEDGASLIGRVVSASGNHSRVALLTDGESAVAARTLEGGPVGVVSASVGNPDELILDLIADDDEFKGGAMVVTAGFSDGDLTSIFPRDIPIGKVGDAAEGQQELNNQVTVTPFVDFDDIDNVTVLGTSGGAG